MNRTVRWLLPLVLLVLVCALGLWFYGSAQPASLRAEDLEPAETPDAYPDTELTLEVREGQLHMVFSNQSDVSLESGAWSDPSGTQFFDVGLAVLLDGQWYAVPCGDYAVAGYGLTIDPGASVEGFPYLDPYSRLPDGAYRIAFSYWLSEHPSGQPFSQWPHYEACARFDLENGAYQIPAA